MKSLLITFTILSSTTFAAKLNYVLGSGVLKGKVTTAKNCSKENLEIFISQKKRVFYQIPTVDKGEFMAHVVPGSYDVVAIGRRGCLFEKKIRIEKDKLVNLEMRLTPASKKSSSILEIIPKAHAASGLCIDCLNNYRMGGGPSFNYGFGGYPMSYYGYQTPWWGPFGHYSYQNFRSPCMGHMSNLNISSDYKKFPQKLATALPVSDNPAIRLRASQLTMGPTSWNGGCGGAMYPGGGQFAAGKPVVYFYGNKGKKFNLKISPNKLSNFLASSPVISNDALELTIGEKGRFFHKTANYSSLFYDVRTNGEFYQAKAGSCVPGKDLLSTMVSMMESSGFIKHEVKDFTDYWSAKLPKYESVCIYPQTNSELAGTGDYEVSPKADSITRLLFVVVPEINGQRPLGKFSQRPDVNWSFKKRMPSSKGSFVIREWGVAFMMTPLPKRQETLKYGVLDY